MEANLDICQKCENFVSDDRKRLFCFIDPANQYKYSRPLKFDMPEACPYQLEHVISNKRRG